MRTKPNSFRPLKSFTGKELLAIKAEFIRQSLAAANHKTESLAWFDSLIMPWNKDLLVNTPVLVIDYGGSFVRTGVAFSPDGITVEWKRPPQKEKIIYEYTDTYAFINWFIGLTQSLIKNFHIQHVGLIFSQAFEARRFKQHVTGKVFNLSKALTIPGLIGKDMGKLYLNALEAKNISLKRLAMLNDTVALALCQKNANVALVIGTGANICSLHPQLPNLRNVEAGYFNGVPLSLTGACVDLVDNPGSSLMEKQSTGMYQYRLLAYEVLLNNLRPEISQEIMKIGDRSASLVVSQFAQNHWSLVNYLTLRAAEKQKLTSIAQTILKNSWQMWAAAVTAVMEMNQRKLDKKIIQIPVTGGVVLNDAIYLNGLKQSIETLSQKSIELIPVPDPIKGAVAAALME